MKKSYKFEPEIITLSELDMTSEIESLMNMIGEIRLSTSEIDFGCNFKGGICFSERNRLKTDTLALIQPMCCCSCCALNSGYMHGEICTAEMFKFYKNNWNDTLGFWREGMGCCLPRESRSIVCIYYSCEDCCPSTEKLAELEETDNKLRIDLRNLAFEIIKKKGGLKQNRRYNG